MKKKRCFVIPACVLAGVALLCLGVWGLMEYFGSPLIPGSLERRYAREVAAHRQELLDFSQQCLETGAVPEGALCRALCGTSRCRAGRPKACL